MHVLNNGNDPDIETAWQNFKVLFARLGELQRRAVQDRQRLGMGRRVDRVIAAFLSDRDSQATRSDVKILLEKVEALLDTTPESEEIRKRIRLLRTDHHLNADLSQSVENFGQLAQSLEAMKYAGVYASQDVGA